MGARLKFYGGLAFLDASELAARAADELGYDPIAIPDPVATTVYLPGIRDPFSKISRLKRFRADLGLD